jgi:hypothetical protein
MKSMAAVAEHANHLLRMISTSHSDLHANLQEAKQMIVHLNNRLGKNLDILGKRRRAATDQENDEYMTTHATMKADLRETQMLLKQAIRAVKKETQLKNNSWRRIRVVSQDGEGLVQDENIPESSEQPSTDAPTPTATTPTSDIQLHSEKTLNELRGSLHALELLTHTTTEVRMRYFT